MTDEKQIAARVAQLRIQAGVSARDMSLTLGQNPGYINNIETGKTRPSIMGILYICDYFKISPSEFFDFEAENPVALREATNQLKHMNNKQITLLNELLKELMK